MARASAFMHSHVAVSDDAAVSRWVALGALVANVAFTYLSQAMGLGYGTNAEISDRYPSLFTPAGYAFSIWGVIYAAAIAYGVYQVLPGQRGNLTCERLAWPWAMLNLLSIGWLVAFSYERIALSLGILAAMLIVSSLLYDRAHAGFESRRLSAWGRVPFALTFAWLSVATIANTAVWLVSRGWRGGTFGEPSWTVAMVTFAGVAGFVVGWRFREPIYPAVIAWAAFGIWSARRLEHDLLANFALTVGVAMAMWTAVSALRMAIELGGARRLTLDD